MGGLLPSAPVTAMNLPQLTLQLLAKPTSASGRPDAALLVLAERDLPGQGAPVFLKAQPGVVYNLVDKQTGRVVAAQTTRRKDKHLEVEFEGRSVLVVQDFYETDAALGPESLHLAAQADDTLNLADLSAYGEQWANWDRIFGGDDVLTADLSSPAAGTAVGSGPTVAPATSVSTTAGSATSSAVGSAIGSAVSAVPAVGITGVTGTAVAPVTGVASPVGAASGLGGPLGGVAALVGAAALGGRDSSAAASQGPIATVLSLGTGVANGATSAEATAAGGVLTVVAQASASVAVTFTGQNGSVTKTVTGNGATPVAVVLLNSDLTTLGQGSVSVSAVTTGVTGSTTTTFTLDTTAPNAPALTSIEESPTQVTLNPGDSTDDNTPTLRYSLTGSQAVAGDRIQLYNGGTALGSAQVLTQTDIVNGFVDVTPSALYAGQYSFNAKLIDAAGNESTASSNRSQTVLITANQRLQSEPGEDDGNWNQAQDRPALDMARLSGDGYVIAWAGFDNGNGNAEAIYVQRYDAQNQAVGGPVVLNSMLGGGQDVLPQVAALSNGGYVVTWTDGADVLSLVLDQNNNIDGAHAKTLQGATSNASDYPQVLALASGGYVLAWQGTTTDGHAADVYVQAFRADGIALGVEHRLSTGLGAADGIPALAALSDGGYLVSWSGAGGSDIFVQRYDNQSDDSGYSRVQLSGVGATSNVNPSIAVLADDGYVLTWEGNVAGAGREVFTQRFDENDAPVDPVQRMQVQTGVLDTFIPKVAALSDGGYVLVWNEETSDAQGYDIFIQRFDVNNAAVGNGHRVAHAAGEDDYQPNVLALPNGGYVIAWTGLTGNNWSFQDIYVQQYGADDQPISAPQRLQGTEGDFEDWGMPALLDMADGGYVVSWEGSTDDAQGYDIFAQRFDAMGLPVL